MASPIRRQHWKGPIDEDWHRPSTHRTVLDFQFDGDALSVADDWADRPQNRHWSQPTNPPTADLVATDRADGTRLYACNHYSHGTGRRAGLLPPGKGDGMFVSIRQVGVQVHFEAWLSERGWYRIFAPAEQAIGGGGFRQRFPRWQARQFINPLLEALGQPPIH
jgi:hypothetical protein